MKFLYGAGSHSQFHQSLSLHSNKKKTFIFIQWNQLWNWWCWLKIYYNSISRQSGIVHKDKAMRQLDLDLWEMNWLVAAARESTNSIIFSLWEWEKRDWIVWFPLAARPLFKNLWFLMKAGGGASQSINHQSTILFNQNKKVCFVEELLELMKLILIERSEPRSATTKQAAAPINSQIN